MAEAGDSPGPFYHCGVCQKKIHGPVMISRHLESNVHHKRMTLCRTLLKDIRRVLQSE